MQTALIPKEAVFTEVFEAHSTGAMPHADPLSSAQDPSLSLTFLGVQTNLCARLLSATIEERNL